MSIEKIMEQAQVFASAWSVVGGPFDGGDAMEVATQEKDELRRMVAELVEERDALAAKLAELEGQYPVFAFRRRGLPDFCTCTEGRYAELAEKPHLFEVRKLYARPVPAEPVNARLLDVAVWPAGYCRDPNGKMSIPAGKEEDFNFGYDVGFQEAWEILNSAISAEGEEQMTDVTKDLLEALKAAQAYVCGPTAWTQEQEDTLVEAMSKAIARAEAAKTNPSDEVRLATEERITLFCLGNGDRGCDGCQREKDWQTLNQLPDPLRLAIHGQAKRIDDTVCILTGRPLYKPSTCGD